ncbi:MAG TPA: response regulator, partial [Opitutaceae bacterium]
MIPPEKYILLAEDDSVVAELILHTLANHTPAPRVVHVKNGVEALDFLYARRQDAGRPGGQPCVALLDLKMPLVDGLEVLRQVKGDAHLKAMPVVMLTSSQDDGDVSRCYQAGANAYVVKPVEFRRFAVVLQQLELFWVGINHPPPDARPGVAMP